MGDPGRPEEEEMGQGLRDKVRFVAASVGRDLKAKHAERPDVRAVGDGR
jgi:hypothetical protein